MIRCNYPTPGQYGVASHTLHAHSRDIGFQRAHHVHARSPQPRDPSILSRALALSRSRTALCRSVSFCVAASAWNEFVSESAHLFHAPPLPPPPPPSPSSSSYVLLLLHRRLRSFDSCHKPLLDPFAHRLVHVLAEVYRHNVQRYYEYCKLVPVCVCVCVYVCLCVHMCAYSRVQPSCAPRGSELLGVGGQRVSHKGRVSYNKRAKHKRVTHSGTEGETKLYHVIQCWHIS
jgi:hypothetical protein